MPSDAPQTQPWSGPAFAAEHEVMAIAEQTARMIAVAQALVACNRRVDLEGIQRQVGLLCAKALDLPPARAGLARAELRRLATSLDALHDALRCEPP